MPEFDERLNQLQTRLENLLKHQEYFQREISQMRYEINVLREVQQKRLPVEQKPFAKQAPPARNYIPPPRSRESEPPHFTEKAATSNENPPPIAEPVLKSAGYSTMPAQVKEKSDLEKFIGENLISKIGIVILVLGVAIGAKYAIDNNLISPLARIVLGYLFGIALVGLAVRLKEKYHNFSAVLLSGGMAIMYFITYAAYSYYDLITQPVAFVLMLMFTIFTVSTALIYERVVIAHIGLVGAYTVPFLLSDNSGRVSFLFSYMIVINAGILAVSIGKYWKSLFYSSFVVTWLVFNGWYLTAYRTSEQFPLAFSFATGFFMIFYLTFLAYKIRFREEISVENVSLVLMNTFIYYGLGYTMVASLAGGKEYLGTFTMLNAGLHFVVAFTLSRLDLAEKSVIYLPTALILVFITIAVPVQLEGNWITLAWTSQAAVLFWLGRTKSIPLFEYFSYPQMAISSISLLNDWQMHAEKYITGEAIPFPILNAGFLTALLFVAAFALIYFLDRSEKYEPAVKADLRGIVRYGVPIVLLVALYNALRIEIGNYFHLEMARTAIRDANRNTVAVNHNLEIFNIVWQTNYTMLFLSLLALGNIRKLKSAALGFTNLVLNAGVLFVFLTVGLYLLSELREIYLLPNGNQEFQAGISHLVLRYASFFFAAGLIFSIYRYFKQDFIQSFISKEHLGFIFEFILYFSLWIALSSELLNWMDIFGYRNSYKLGLSILWGIYSLGLVVLGIVKKEKYLRVGAIALFALTLVKLFFYDIADLDTISKTIVFVSLGILLLIISFLYNKYKNLIFAPNEV